MKNLRIVVAQLGFLVGDIKGNVEKILDVARDAYAEGADLVVYPECCVSGYPPEDLVLINSFQQQIREAVHYVAREAKDLPALLIGAPWKDGDRLYNAAILMYDDAVQHLQYKHDLPNYGIFDEKRVFASGDIPHAIEFKGLKLGIMICEDMWNMKVTHGLIDADLIVSINGSPFEMGKYQKRRERAISNINQLKKPLIYCNQICGQDDLFFDGDSFIMNERGEEIGRLSRVKEEIRHIECEWVEGRWSIVPSEKTPDIRGDHAVYQAMMLSLRDYVTKNGFPGVVIGMSGGIDSALSAAIAVDALGADKVKLVMMPSRYTSKESLDDASDCAGRLGANIDEISIESSRLHLEKVLEPAFEGHEKDLTEENLQARLRGVILMAISNKFGHMVLSTGNKSEVAVGYATLYGDMCGGYNVLKDVYKTHVFALSRWRNQHVPAGAFGPEGEVIPERIITKPPTAELRDDQKDEDSLPPYDVLDAILYHLIEEQKSADDLVAIGYDYDIIQKVRKLLHFSEYKRKQSAPGVKISVRPFGRDRRHPIMNKWY